MFGVPTPKTISSAFSADKDSIAARSRMLLARRVEKYLRNAELADSAEQAELLTDDYPAAQEWNKLAKAWRKLAQQFGERLAAANAKEAARIAKLKG